MKYCVTFLVLFIAFVSAMDVYVTVELRDYIVTFEENPFQRYLMNSTGSVAICVALRLFLTCVSLCGVVVGYNMREKFRNWTILLLSVVSIAHIYLLYVLTQILRGFVLL